MTPREIVQELDKHIIGQDEAKRAVAIALPEPMAPYPVDEPLRSEITPKNILMIGPTGIGKTENIEAAVETRQSAFIKVEATKSLKSATSAGKSTASSAIWSTSPSR